MGQGGVLIGRVLILLGLAVVAHAAFAAEPVPIRVVVVTTFEQGEDTGDAPGEFQNWVERLPLKEIIPFPQGYHALRYNRDQHVLGIVTGEGKSHAAASITALGYDPRFDLSKAYWILAGIAGIDPSKGSVGSAVWAHYAVDGDLGYEIDASEIPKDWPTGIIPYDRSTPYEQPVPSGHSNWADQLFHLNEGLADWAYHQTIGLTLADDATLQKVRARYQHDPKALTAPMVLLGDTLTADRFWVGRKMTGWSEKWVDYWTHGKGVAVTSAEEDTGYLQALSFLAQVKRVDFARAMDLRTASDYTAPPDGEDAAHFLAGEAHGALSGYREALDSAYVVGSKVVLELAGHWDKYEDHIPTATP
jgi:purine nucleoside permease